MQTEDIETQKRNIISTAASLIKADIDDIREDRNVYPKLQGLGDIESNMSYLPMSLRRFLSEIFQGHSNSNKMKIAAIDQSIMQQARPKTLMAPLQFGLSMQLHWKYGSRDLIENLNTKGFCLSYDEAKLFKACAANYDSDTFANLQGSFCHVIGDNFDHNTVTLNGKGTYHGMGLMLAATPGVKPKYIVPRSPLNTLQKQSSLEIVKFRKLGKLGETLIYNMSPVIEQEDAHQHLGILWKISFPLKCNRPGWSGFMQTVTNGPYPGKSSFHFLPMVDLDPTNLSCIYSTLVFTDRQCKKNNIDPIITFDQPLYLKAKLIITQEDDLKHIVLNLGGFHTIMSFNGSIGHIMKSTGLRTILELSFAENTVTHMLTGKAHARALRGHFLVDSSLNALIAQRTFDADEDKVLIEQALDIFNSLIESSSETVLVNNSDEVIVTINERIQQTKCVVSQSPTGKLWIQYMKMIDILRTALRAQRTGNFILYLKAIQEMLPFFAASGLNNYTKSICLYLQDMLQLKDTNHRICTHFINGHFVLRRTDRFWAGLPKDLVIEQVLMRALKTTGGLTHGRGMNETQRTRWLLTTPVFAHIDSEMEILCKKSPSGQHKEVTLARIRKDQTDTEEILEYLRNHNPFVESNTLFDISTGISSLVANPQNAEEIGKKILQKMEGQKVSSYIFRKSDQVKTLGEKVTSQGEVITVDPQLLFQRLIVIANNTDLSLDELFKYELSVYRPALFNKQGFLNCN